MARARSGSLAGSGFAVVLSLSSAACSLSGLDDRYGQSTDASADATGNGEAGDTGSAAEAASDGCRPTENCTNGIDDDCNGLVDCADPACTKAGFACTAAAISTGWTLVAYSAAARPVCPASYGAEHAVISNVDGGAATCSCGCSGTSATCEGTATYNGYPNACSTGAQGVNLAINDGNCSGTSQGLTMGHYYQQYFASAASPQQGSCSGAGMLQGAPTPTFAAGATCAAPAMLGAGCSTGACAPPTGTAFVACVSHPGAVACPTFGFTQRTLVSTGTPGYVDMRTCGACPCATSLTCGTVTNIALFTSGNCTGGAAMNVNPGCGLAGGSASIGSYSVSFPRGGSASCQPTGSSPPGGSVDLDSNVQTVCCAH